VSFLVFSEDRELAFQLLGKARELADKMGSEVAALATGADPMEYFSQGADRVYTVSGIGEFSVEPYGAAVVEAVKAANPSTVFIGATKRGK
jgi:electron transfer flavoprotein alpha subunit